MDDLNAQAKAVLERARPAFSPSAEQLERLRQRLHHPGPTDGGDLSVPHPKRSLLKLGAVGLAGILAAGAAAVASRSPRSADAVTRAISGPLQDLEREDAGTRGQPVLREAPRLSVPHAEPPPAPPAPDEARPAAIARARPRLAELAPEPTAPEPVSPEAEGPSSLAAELELIVAARQRLRDRDYEGTRSLAERYRRRFPEGSFREEAEVLQLVAACRDAPSDALRDRARRYLAAGRASFVDRVREACLGDLPPR